MAWLYEQGLNQSRYRRVVDKPFASHFIDDDHNYHDATKFIPWHPDACFEDARYIIMVFDSRNRFTEDLTSAFPPRSPYQQLGSALHQRVRALQRQTLK